MRSGSVLSHCNDYNLSVLGNNNFLHIYKNVIIILIQYGNF